MPPHVLDMKALTMLVESPLIKPTTGIKGQMSQAARFQRGQAPLRSDIVTSRVLNEGLTPIWNVRHNQGLSCYFFLPSLGHLAI